jgi:hypothetical protein
MDQNAQLFQRQPIPPLLPSAPFPPSPLPNAFAHAPSLDNLPRLPLTAPGDDWVVDFDEVQAFQEANVAGRYTKLILDGWLASEKKWKHRIGKGWRGKRVLGMGGQGIVGHWTYEGPDRDRKTVKDIAVKQALRYGRISCVMDLGG